MGKLPYQLIVNILSFFGIFDLIQGLEALSFGPVTEDFEKKSLNSLEKMPHPQISNIK